MKRLTFLLFLAGLLALLLTRCGSQRHIVENVGLYPPITPMPIQKILDTTHYTYTTIPRPTPVTIVDPKNYFEDAYKELKEMLQGTRKPDFERAVFVSENPYHNNQYTYKQFQQELETPLYCIKSIIKANDKSDSMDFNSYVGANGKFKMADMRYLPKEKKELYKKALTNWAIFKYITDTTVIYPFYNVPFDYIAQDPFGKNDWSNSQVIHLLTSNEKQGNCFSLTALYKILANRLQSDAKLCTAPQHIYIQNRDPKGDYYNVELATAGFPRDGTLQTLTHTTTDAIMSGIALRDYTEQQSIGLCIINLAKSYERYFETNSDEFLLRCAETTLQFDSLNLNALLLKEQVLDSRVVNYARQANSESIIKMKQDKNIQQTLADLEAHTALLYRLGYRQMPLDMQQIILSGNYPDSGFVDKNPSPFTTVDPKNAKTAKYHALYGGLFQEVFETRPAEPYGHFIFDTKTKQLRAIDVKAQENELIDPVAFAYDFGARIYDSRLGRFASVDPLQQKFPFQSPYSAFADNPILFVDPDGKEVVWSALIRSVLGNSFIERIEKISVFKQINEVFYANNDNVFYSIGDLGGAGFSTIAASSANRNDSRVIPKGAQGYGTHINDLYVVGGKFTGDLTGLAMVLSHEAYHNKISQSIDANGISNYPTYQEYRKKYPDISDANMEHEYIAQYARGQFVEAGKKFDQLSGTSHTEDWYQAMSWSGLTSYTEDGMTTETKAWTDFKAQKPTKAALYEKIQINEVMYSKYIKAKDVYEKDKTDLNKSFMDNAKSDVDWGLYQKTRSK